ncbi:MAG: hypothetical protein ACREJ3_06035, partial [Polyangiaceae bacterium]
LKPMVAALFPVTFDGGLLHASNEIADSSLQCIGDGPTLYAGVRAEIEWYFGAAMAQELDGLQARLPQAAASPSASLAARASAK